ncbi:unnamed protein product, partial [Symbiodinium microadriaticum]
MHSHFQGARDGRMDDLQLCDSEGEDANACDSDSGCGRGAAQSGRCDRRRLIMESKGLRQEIQQFEDHWYADHNRQPL